MEGLELCFGPFVKIVKKRRENLVGTEKSSNFVLTKEKHRGVEQW